jgi:hypothetical protein
LSGAYSCPWQLPRPRDAGCEYGSTIES